MKTITKRTSGPIEITLKMSEVEWIVRMARDNARRALKSK